MESEDKENNVEVPITSKKFEFLDLNDDCMIGVFRKLSLNDLCTISCTCKRLQQLAYYHFQHENPDEWMHISEDRKRCEKYQKYFGKYIQNVSISFGHYEAGPLFRFINTVCSTDMKRLKISVCARKTVCLNSTHGEIIKEQLKNLEILQIQGNHQYHRFDLHESLLKHCVKLRDLYIDSVSDDDANWMHHGYPSLQSLTFLAYPVNKDHIKKFDRFAKEFFTLNPQLNDITCMEGSVKTILLSAKDIKRLSIKLSSSDVIEYLKDYVKISPIDWLEIRYPWYWCSTSDSINLLNSLVDLNSVQPVHSLELKINSTDGVSKLLALKHLRQITLKFTPTVQMDVIWRQLAKELCNLQEVYLQAEEFDDNKYPTIILNEMLLQFISHSILRKIKIILHHQLVFQPNDLIELNKERLLLSGASCILIELEVHKGHPLIELVPVAPYSSTINLKILYGRH